MRSQDNRSATFGGFRQFDADRRADQASRSAASDDLAPTIVNTRVSVVIPHYSDLEQLDRCLTLLQQQTYPADLFEIVVFSVSVSPLKKCTSSISWQESWDKGSRRS